MTFPFDPLQGLIMVRAEVSGPSGSAVIRLALDTGATRTLISTRILIAIGYDPAAAVDRVPFNTGNGIEFSPRLEIDRLTSLDREVVRFPILSHYSAADRRRRWASWPGLFSRWTIVHRLSIR